MKLQIQLLSAYSIQDPEEPYAEVEPIIDPLLPHEKVGSNIKDLLWIKLSFSPKKFYGSVFGQKESWCNGCRLSSI